MTKEEKYELIELSDLNREDNIKYISSEAQGIAITLDSDRYAPTLCKLERAYICGRRKSEKRIEDLEQKLEQTEKDLADYQFNYPTIKELQKENKELKEQGDKWFVFETEAGNWGMDKATQYTVDRHNYFYGTKEECQKWGVEHKIKDYTGHKYCYDRLDNQLTKAKEIIKDQKELLDRVLSGAETLSDFAQNTLRKAEQFIKEIEK